MKMNMKMEHENEDEDGGRQKDKSQGQHSRVHTKQCVQRSLSKDHAVTPSKGRGGVAGWFGGCRRCN